jgi:hypothetical protein
VSGLHLSAITLGLEALRKVERYGITKRGEQHTGWRQIEAAGHSAADARSFLLGVLHEHDDVTAETAEQLEDEALVRTARRFTHPDAKTGAHAAFLSVQRAAETLGVA